MISNLGHDPQDCPFEAGERALVDIAGNWRRLFRLGGCP